MSAEVTVKDGWLKVRTKLQRGRAQLSAEVRIHTGKQRRDARGFNGAALN